MDLELDSIYCADLNASQVWHRYHFPGRSFISVVCPRQRLAVESGFSKDSSGFRSDPVFFYGFVYLGLVSVVLVAGDDAVCAR